MRTLFLTGLLVLVLGAAAGWLMQQDAGYVLVQFQGYTLETSVWVALALVLLITVAGWLSLLALKMLLGVAWMVLGRPQGGVLAQWRRYWAQQKNRAMNRAVVEFYRGRWRRALRPLAQAARRSDAPLMYQLLAARCAEELGDHELADGFLELAANDPVATDVVAVARAEMAARRGHVDAALSVLQSLNADASGHPAAVRLQAELLLREQQWEALTPRLAELRRYQVLPAEALDRLELLTQRARLDACVSSPQPLDALRKLWQSLPGRVRKDVEITTHYVQHLQRLGAGDEAASLLEQDIQASSDARLIRAYGLSQSNDTGKQLRKIEKMLSQRPEDAALLLAAGRIAARNKLWGKARDYLKASEARAEDTTEVRAALASLSTHPA